MLVFAEREPSEQLTPCTNMARKLAIYIYIMEYVQMMRKDRMNMIQIKVSFVIKNTSLKLKLTMYVFGTISQVVPVVHCMYYCYFINRKHDLTMI